MAKSLNVEYNIVLTLSREFDLRGTWENSKYWSGNGSKERIYLKNKEKKHEFQMKIMGLQTAGCMHAALPVL